MSAAFQKHLDAIASGKVMRTNIIGLRKALNEFERARNRYSRSTTATQITAEEYSEAERLIKLHHPTAIGELHTNGLSVLRNPRYRSRWNDEQRRVIDSNCHFELVRFDWLTSVHCVPVWRAVSPAGEHFTFRTIPWQTAWSLGLGDGPCVVRS